MTEEKIFLVRETKEYLDERAFHWRVLKRIELTPELIEKIRNEVKEYIVGLEDTHQLNSEQEFNEIIDTVFEKLKEVLE